MASRPIHILIVAAHPADSFDQAGGTMAHHIAQGDSVTCVIATTGVRSHHWQLTEEKRQKGADFDIEARVQEAVEEKLEETRRACRILGFDDLRDLGFEDDDILVGEVAYAEPFQRFTPMVRYTLPVTDAELATIDLSPEAGMGRRSEIIGGLMPLPAGMSFSDEYRFSKEQYED